MIFGKKLAKMEAQKAQFWGGSRVDIPGPVLVWSKYGLFLRD